MKKFMKSVLSLVLAMAVAFTMAGCGASEGQADTQTTQEDAGAAADASAGEAAEAAPGEKIVNVGVTDSLGGINPLTIDQTEINKYAVGLMFLPLYELNADMSSCGMLADSITTEDNKTFTIHINDAAVWSDGEPVTAEEIGRASCRERV